MFLFTGIISGSSVLAMSETCRGVKRKTLSPTCESSGENFRGIDEPAPSGIVTVQKEIMKPSERIEVQVYTKKNGVKTAIVYYFWQDTVIGSCEFIEPPCKVSSVKQELQDRIHYDDLDLRVRLSLVTATREIILGGNEDLFSFDQREFVLGVIVGTLRSQGIARKVRTSTNIGAPSMAVVIQQLRAIVGPVTKDSVEDLQSLGKCLVERALCGEKCLFETFIRIIRGFSDHCEKEGNVTGRPLEKSVLDHVDREWQRTILAIKKPGLVFVIGKWERIQVLTKFVGLLYYHRMLNMKTIDIAVTDLLLDHATVQCDVPVGQPAHLWCAFDLLEYLVKLDKFADNQETKMWVKQKPILHQWHHMLKGISDSFNSTYDKKTHGVLRVRLDAIIDTFQTNFEKWKSASEGEAAVRVQTNDPPDGPECPGGFSKSAGGLGVPAGPPTPPGPRAEPAAPRSPAPTPPGPPAGPAAPCSPAPAPPGPCAEPAAPGSAPAPPGPPAGQAPWATCDPSIRVIPG